MHHQINIFIIPIRWLCWHPFTLSPFHMESLAGLINIKSGFTHTLTNETLTKAFHQWLQTHAWSQMTHSDAFVSPWPSVQHHHSKRVKVKPELPGTSTNSRWHLRAVLVAPTKQTPFDSLLQIDGQQRAVCLPAAGTARSLWQQMSVQRQDYESLAACQQEPWSENISTILWWVWVEEQKKHQKKTLWWGFRSAGCKSIDHQHLVAQQDYFESMGVFPQHWWMGRTRARKELF